MFRQYRNIERHVLNLVAAEFLIQLVNNAFLAIQLIYMQKCGYSDHEGAGFVSFRFLGVLLLALPLGQYLKGRKIKPLFYIACWGVPLTAIGIIMATYYHWNWWLYVFQFLWGVSFTFMQIPVLPFILRNAHNNNHTEAISLSYATYSFGGILSGVIIYVLSKIDPVFFDERSILIVIALLGFASLIFIRKIKIAEEVPFRETAEQKTSRQDWKLIAKALFPTLIIATGAGLTIPFIGIFFFNVHHLDSDQFSVLNAIGAVLVAVAAMWVPQVKKRFGYKTAIPATQSLAVLALIFMATTQFYNSLYIAVYIAMICYLLRQPLMNMAGPMTTDVIMNYVGKKNREIVSGLTSAIWSGSWFISSIIFKALREKEIAYAYVFLITAALYAVGVLLYYLLLIEYTKSSPDD
jgi:MFS family permease